MSAIQILLQKIIPKNRMAEKTGSAVNKREQRLSGRRAAVTEALNKSVEIFSTHKEETFDEVMSTGIRPLVDAVGIDRVVFYTLVERDGVKRFGQIYRWGKSEGGLMLPADELRVLPYIPVVEKWISITSQGDCVRLRESDYSEDEAVFLRTYGIKSILMVPIFTHREFWGVVSFQDHTTGRYFDDDCADLLYSAAYIFTNAIIRTGMERRAEEAIKALKRREKMADTLNKIAIRFLS
jgi:GAF domain-containing protein